MIKSFIVSIFVLLLSLTCIGQTTWAGTSSNQWVTRQVLQDAVTNGIFTLNPGQSIPGTDITKWVTKSEVETWINATVSSGTSTQWPQKSWIVASSSVLIFSSYTYATNIAICDYEDLPNTVYRDLSDTGPYFSDEALTTPAPGSWINRNDLGYLQYISSGGGIGARVYQLNSSLPTNSLQTHVSTGTSSSVISVFNYPMSTTYELNATITTTDNNSIPWYIEVRADGSIIATSTTNSNSSVGQTNTVTFNDNTCQSISISIRTSLGSPAGVESEIITQFTYTLP